MGFDDSPLAMAEELGGRLKQARLNADLTQSDLARQAGVSRKVLMNAEKGKVTLDAFVAVMSALDLLGELDHFLPKQVLSPLQLAKLQGKQRQRASGNKKVRDEIREEPLEW
jgi:DNA-binding XRE family transcriptional regulator